MNGKTTRQARINEVRRLFDEYGFGNAELLEGWDGADLDDLSEHLTEEDFQTLVDQMAGWEDDRTT